MKIVFLGLAVPNLDDYLNMYTELMVELDKRGHELLIVGPGEGAKSPEISVEKGIRVLRVPTMQLFNVGLIQKGLANILLPLQYKRALKKSGIDLEFDLVILPTPPITLVNVAAWLKRNHNSKIYLILRDIFPQNAVDLGMMNKNGLPYRYFRSLEKKLYRISDIIGCMSPANVNYVKEHNPEISAKKLKLLPNWTILHPLLKESDVETIRKEYGLLEKFIILFGGNIGRPQRMDNIIELAEICSEYPDLYFLIIGGGSEKITLKEKIKNSGLENIALHDSLTRERFFEVLQIADVGLISLNQDFSIPNFPSKSLAYFNAKIPILASVDINTDFGKILEEVNAGLWSEAGNSLELKSKLLKLYSNKDLRTTMGLNGYNYARANLTVQKAAETLMNHLTE